MGNSHSNPTEPVIEDVVKSMECEEIDEQLFLKFEILITLQAKTTLKT
jgi:hypothetical protein